MPERRTEVRPEASDRRDIRRPPLRLNLLLLCIAVVTLFFARYHRQRIDVDFTRVLNKSSSGPSELNQITAELAELDLNDETLAKELESRLAYIESLKSQEFYLSIDTAKKILSPKSGNETVHEATVRIGAPVALKGAVTVAGKTFMLRPAIKNGPGKYVIRLPSDHAIESFPAGLMKGPKPGSFMVSESDLQAIWDRITPKTRVYIF